MTKKERLAVIVSAIEENELSNQKELTDYLVGKGYSVSQATLSRDINELNLIKTAGAKKKLKYTRGEVDFIGVSKKYIELFKQVCVSLTSAKNLIVVKTLSGNAGTAGMTLDEMRLPEVLGTIAGDDTLLIITKTDSDAERLLKKLRNI